MNLLVFPVSAPIECPLSFHPPIGTDAFALQHSAIIVTNCLAQCSARRERVCRRCRAVDDQFNLAMPCASTVTLALVQPRGRSLALAEQPDAIRLMRSLRARGRCFLPPTDNICRSDARRAQYSLSMSRRIIISLPAAPARQYVCTLSGSKAGLSCEPCCRRKRSGRKGLSTRLHALTAGSLTFRKAFPPLARFRATVCGSRFSLDQMDRAHPHRYR